jgi:hypothetical protein
MDKFKVKTTDEVGVTDLFEVYAWSYKGNSEFSVIFFNSRGNGIFESQEVKEEDLIGFSWD